MRAVTIICPIYNEEKSIPHFYGRLTQAIGPLRDRYAFDVIFVNNASEDGSLQAIYALRENDPSVQVVTHSRDFGYQSSVMCGLHHARGEATVIIDVDCEDPPEMIPQFIAHWEQGYDIVYGQRIKRPENVAMVLARKLFYRITHLIADWGFIIDMAEFSLFTARVRHEILKARSTFPFVRSDLAFVGFRRFGIPYAREPRAFGKTHYNLFRMTEFAIGGMLSASTFPLRLIVYLGVPLTFVNGAALLVDVLWCPGAYLLRMLTADAMYLIFGVSSLAIYLSRTYKDVIGRPVFIVDSERTALNHETKSEPRQLEARSR